MACQTIQGTLHKLSSLINQQFKLSSHLQQGLRVLNIRTQLKGRIQWCSLNDLNACPLNLCLHLDYSNLEHAQDPSHYN